MQILTLLQRAVERLNDVETHLDVRAYVVDEATRAVLPGACAGMPEQLFVRENADEMELALYIDPRVVQRLEQESPAERLHPGNLGSFWVAVEGVSHFIFLAWRATVGRPVTALEMEIQAEVDKFVVAWLWLAEQGATLSETGRLLDRLLFRDFELRPELGEAERDRYREANRAARAYCAHLVRRYGRERAPTRLARDVRAYYRGGLADKLRAA